MQSILWSDTSLTTEYGHPDVDKIEYVYEHYDPSMDDNVTERGVFFTPIGLAQDFNIFTHKRGHIVDVCSGIGMLSYKLLCYSYYENNIESLTLIEYNPKFTEIAKRLISPLSAYNRDNRVVKINFITADAYAKETWENVISSLPFSANGKFNLMISNPPYGKLPSAEKSKYSDHLKYLSERELMAVELCTKYAKHGQFIMPPSSCDCIYSGRPYYERRPSAKVDRLRKALGEDVFFYMEIDGIDCSIYRDEWKNTKITTEVVSINLDRSEYE